MAVIDDAMLALGRDHGTELGHGLTGIGEDLHDLVDLVRFDDRDHADPAIEGPQHFEFGDAGLRGQPFEHRQHWQTRQIDTHTEMLRQHARNVVGEAAAGDMGKPLHRAGLADRAQAGFDVEPRRRQQRAAERHDGRKRRLRSEAEARLFHDLAHQRETVGVHPRRGQPDHGIAGGDVLARQERAPLRGTDGKAAEVVVAVLVEAGHLGRLAADQGATGFAAAFGDTGDDRRGRLRIELAAGKIVQEEQRLGALHHEVVDTHGDEVDADPAMQAGLDRDLDLGADAIGRGH
ncbi:hypothetical protein ACVWZW_002284 [Bradyrhizobium sp. F1.13.4]